MIALQNKQAGYRLATVAFFSGIAGMVLWALSYAWLPFRWFGHETEAVWTFVVISEIMAELAGLIALGIGFYVRKQAGPGSIISRRAKWGFTLGITVCICVIAFNAIGLIFFS